MLRPDWSHLINLPVWDYGMIEKRTREVVDVGHETGARPKTTEKYFKDNAGFGYGNKSEADYFAHTFSAVIAMPHNPNTPPIAEMWMAVLIDLTK
jgi:hypothetical protein